MNVLIATASKHGATREIGEALGRTLAAEGVHATVKDAEEVGALDGYDAFVIGSGVYAGHWLKTARELVAANSDVLSAQPTWLFSSGPLGDPPKPDESHAVDVREIVETSGAREHRVFAGKIDTHALGFAERAVMVAVRAPDGDFREWDEIEAWAREIAESLRAAPA
jgi:menaquinone-dependent protoporphyrinogen oxidase